VRLGPSGERRNASCCVPRWWWRATLEEAERGRAAKSVPDGDASKRISWLEWVVDFCNQAALSR
jgi:hypothetical protein